MLGPVDFSQLRPVTLLIAIASVTGVLGFFVGRLSAVYDASPPARSAVTLSEQLSSRKSFGKADDDRPTQTVMQSPVDLSPADRTTAPLPVVLLNPRAADVGKKTSRGLTPEINLKDDRAIPSNGRAINMSETPGVAGLAESTPDGRTFVEDAPKSGTDGELLVSSNGDESTGDYCGKQTSSAANGGSNRSARGMARISLTTEAHASSVRTCCEDMQAAYSA